jgi:hypothetical protein
MPRKQLLDTFLPNKFTYTIVDSREKADICISSIQLSEKSLLRREEVNILICVENCKKWDWYPHHNKYGDYNNDMIDIFIYNHISSINKNTVDTVAIPTVYTRINHYKMVKNYYETLPQLSCPFSSKKFCLVINKSGLNGNINKFVNILKPYGEVDYIGIYSEKIAKASCYNIIEMLEVFNLYKFILCFENSYNDGYVTEKIFNCFLAKTIPIYSGSAIVEKFLNTDSFIDVPEHKIDTFDTSIIERLVNNEEEYNSMINMDRISANYNDECYTNDMTCIIERKLANADN